MPTGELPRNILMTVDRSMVGTIAPGTRITAVAIYSTVQVSPMPHASPVAGFARLLCTLCMVGTDASACASQRSLLTAHRAGCRLPRGSKAPDKHTCCKPCSAELRWMCPYSRRCRYLEAPTHRPPHSSAVLSSERKYYGRR